MSTTTLDETLVSIGCADRECELTIHLPRWLHVARRHDHRTFYCPDGHSNYYPRGKSEFEKLQDELARRDGQLAAETRRASRLVDELERERRSHSSTKGQLTKTKKRAANGICPCCNRQVPQLAAHMKTKHPDYVADANA